MLADRLVATTRALGAGALEPVALAGFEARREGRVGHPVPVEAARPGEVIQERGDPLGQAAGVEPGEVEAPLQRESRRHFLKQGQCPRHLVELSNQQQHMPTCSWGAVLFSDRHDPAECSHSTRETPA